MKTAKIFRHGNSQAIRPPRQTTYERVMTAVNHFKGKFGRQQPNDQKRKWQ
jgi:hypothetical protein